MALLVLQDLQEPLVLLGQQVILDRQVPQEQLEQLDHKDQLVLLVQQVLQDLLVQLV